MADKTISMTAATSTSIDRSDLLARLRVELHDEDSNNYRWTDATLYRHLERAVREVSQAWPRERLTVLTATAGSRDIDVAGELADLVRLEAVEWPIDQEPRRYVQWSLYQTTLTLLDENIPSAADSVNVYWGSRHLVDAGQSTLPQVTEEAVVQGAAGYAAVEWANYAINRANIGGEDVQLAYRRWAEGQLAATSYGSTPDGGPGRGGAGADGDGRGFPARALLRLDRRDPVKVVESGKVVDLQLQLGHVGYLDRAEDDQAELVGVLYVPGDRGWVQRGVYRDAPRDVRPPLGFRP